MEIHILDIIFYLLCCIPFIIWYRKLEPISWEGGLPFICWVFMTTIYSVVFYHYDLIDLFYNINIGL